MTPKKPKKPKKSKQSMRFKKRYPKKPKKTTRPRKQRKQKKQKKQKKTKKIKSGRKINLLNKEEYKQVGEDRTFKVMKLQDKAEYLADALPEVTQKMPELIKDVLEEIIQNQLTIFLFGKKISRVLDKDTSPDDLVDEIRKCGEIGRNTADKIQNERLSITNELIWQKIMDSAVKKIINTSSSSFGMKLINPEICPKSISESKKSSKESTPKDELIKAF